MQTYYATRAPYYDEVYLKPERREDIAFISAYLAQRLHGRRVLEVACGTGYWTQHIAKTATFVHATDATHEPLAFAKHRPGTQDTQFSLADAYSLPEHLGQFDGAFAGLWFSHVPIGDREAFFHSLHARLTPGARVILIDNSQVQCLEHPIIERDADGNTYQMRSLKDGSVHRVLKIFPTETELSALIAPFAANHTYTPLQNFWLLEYEFHTPRFRPAGR